MFKVVDRRWEVDALALYKARLDAKLTLEEVASLCGVKRSYWSKIENGYVRHINEEKMQRLLIIFPHLETCDNLPRARPL